MKILNLKILKPDDEQIRDIDFKENGASIIWGKVEKPAATQETTNSIGKTLLLRFIGYIFGKQERKGQYDKTIRGWKLIAIVSYKGKQHYVEKILGDNKSMNVDGQRKKYQDYLTFFAIDSGLSAKQILYTRRQNIISEKNIHPTEADTISSLKLLNVTNVINLYTELKKLQGKVKVLTGYKREFKDDLIRLKEQKFICEQEQKQLKKELATVSNKLKTLEISEDVVALINRLSVKRYELKSLKLKQERYRLKVKHLNALIDDMAQSDIKANDVITIFEQMKIHLPEMINRELHEVQGFYDAMFKDKHTQYTMDIAKYETITAELANQISHLSAEVDKIAAVVANNELFTEAMDIYQLKNEALVEVQTKVAGIQGSIANLSQKQKIEHDISIKYDYLEEALNEYETLIQAYKQYIYDLVFEIYGAKNTGFFNVSVSNSTRKLTSNPLVFDLNLRGDFGEGISAVKNILMDILFFSYNTQVDYLIHDSSCFEGIDCRQLPTLIKIIHQVGIETDKQYIFAMNEYQMLARDNTSIDLLDTNTAITLSEDNTLLSFRF